MAGDWIKVEEATVDKPEVLRTADLLGIHRREALGLFVEFWMWLDKNLSEECPDFVRNTSRKSLDNLLHVPGFSAVLEQIGWARWDDEGAVLHVVNADRHNGNTAKTRASDAKRKKNQRENVRKMSGSETDKSVTREEKRREDKELQPPLAASKSSAVRVDALVADGLTTQTAAEFLQARRAKRAPLTARAWEGIKAEAGRAGWPVERAVLKALQRGWQSFEAKWVEGEAPAAAGAKPWEGAH